MRKPVAFTFCFLLTVGGFCNASGTVTPEPGGDRYNFVSHYRIQIDAPASEVWVHLVDLGSWMYDFEMSHVSGPRGEVGEVLRLYPGQEFYVQITKAEPERILVMANLPSTFRDEESTGIGVITLNTFSEGTIVDLTMSRRYDWRGQGQNPNLEVRGSDEFNSNTDAMWNRFLKRLEALVVGT